MTRLSVKKFLTIFMVVILLCFNIPSFAAASASGECGDNVTWVLNGGVLTISGTGPMQNWTKTEPSPFFENEEIHTVNIQSGVTSVGAYAFYKCNGLTTVNMADSVQAVNDCSFRNCSSLGNIVFSSGLKTIGDEAFVDCVVKKLVFPEGLISIGEGAFAGCGAIAVIMPDTVTSLGEYAFEQSTMSFLVLSSGLKEIPDSALADCDNLVDVTIPEGVTTIKESAFENGNWQSITIPSTVTEIKSLAFAHCQNLQNIYVDDENPIISDDNGVLITHGGRLLLQYPCGRTENAYRIPHSIEVIEEHVFSEVELKCILMPKSVKYISEDAFYRCNYLDMVYY